MKNTRRSLMFSLALVIAGVGCEDDGAPAAAESDAPPKSTAPTKKKDKPKLSKEELAAMNRKVWDSGRAYLEKMAAVHAAVPKRGGGVKKCDDAKIKARVTASFISKQPTLVDEAYLTFIATGKRPKEDPKEWAWIRQPIWLTSVARLRAEGDKFDPTVPRGDLQNAMKYLPKQPYMGVIRFKKRLLPTEKNGKTQAGGFIADLFIMDVEKAELACQSPYDVDQGGKYVHFTPGAQKGVTTALEAAKRQLGRLARDELKARLESISTVLLAPAEFSFISDRRIPPVASAAPTTSSRP